MKKSSLFILVLIIFGLFFVFRGGSLLGEEVQLTRIAYAGERASNGYVTVPFTRNSEKYSFVNISVDFNQDGRISSYETDDGTQEEWVVQNMGVRILKDEANNFSVLIPDLGIEERGDLQVHIVLSGDELRGWDGQLSSGSEGQEYTLTQVSIEDYGDLYSPTGEGTGGIGALFGSVALAQNIPGVPSVGTGAELSGEGAGDSSEGTGEVNTSFNEFHPNVPDIPQGRNECVPTSVANSILWLAKENKFEDKLPEGGAAAIISELKTDMNWTADNGVVVPSNFLPGKNAFTQRHDLPIETHQVGGTFDLEIVSQIAEELKKGQDVEIDMEYGVWGADGSYQRVGGHMVTVVGAWTAGSSQFLDIHDPVSTGPGTLDIYRIDGARVVDYRFQGRAVTYIRFAIAESPIVETPTPTETVTSEPTPEETSEPTSEPTTEPTEEPVTETPTPERIIALSIDFEHVKPGEYSEVYLEINFAPDIDFEAVLEGPSVDEPIRRQGRLDSNGHAKETWRIFSFGEYRADVIIDGTTYPAFVSVQE